MTSTGTHTPDHDRVTTTAAGTARPESIRVMVDHVGPTCTLLQVRAATLPTITHRGETFAVGGIAITRGFIGEWWITAEGADIDCRKTRTGAINAALAAIGVNRRDSHVTIIEDKEY